MALTLNLDALPWRAQFGLVAGLTAVGVGAFWYFYADPFQADQAGRWAALRKTRTEIEWGRNVAKRLPEFRKDVTALETQLEGLRVQLPEDQDVADLLRRVQTMATDSRLTIRGFTPQPVSRKDRHAEWPIGLEIEGTYHDLGAFFEQVSRFSRIINIGNIRIEARENPAPGATVVAVCTAIAFVLVTQEDDPGTPPEKAKKKPDAVAAAPVHEGDAYKPDGRRDPFVSLLRRATQTEGVTGSRVAGLKGLGANEVTLRGTVASQGGYVAILQGSDSRTYIVRPGEHLADGTIRSITADALVILQQINDPLSLEKQREVRKVLRQTDAARP